MATTREDISRWFDRGVEDEATHMIVVCDSFDYDDYPVYVYKGQDAREKANEYNKKSMQRVMECYDLSMDKEAQLGERRAHHY